MQKEISCTKKNRVVGDIFRTMAYNEKPLEDFSLMNCLPSGDKICSIVNGKYLDTALLTESKYKFKIGQKNVKVGVLDEKSLEPVLAGLKNEEESWDKTRALERLGRFEKLLKKLEGDLCMVEGLGRGLPFWQISAYDLPTWRRMLEEILSENASFAEVGRTLEFGRKAGRVVHILMKLKREEYSLHSFLAVIIQSILFEGKCVLSISPSSAASSSLLLPPFYLVDALNKAKIRKTPIDLLIVDPSPQTLDVFYKSPSCGQILVWGNFDGLKEGGVEVTAGVLIPERIPSIHFVLDSSADVASAVEAIAEETWCSGGRVNLRARSLLFVHQPIHKQVITQLEKKIGALRISEDSCHHKSTDFITTTLLRTQQDLYKAQLQTLGVKIIPSNSDLLRPTVLHEIGTCVDLVANKVPGMGHLLCVIPYRSNTELVSLANNHGSLVDTRIYASDIAVVKKLVGSLKGKEIRVNSSGKKGLTNIIINDSWLFLHKPDPQLPSTISTINTQPNKDGFPLGEAEKGLKSWTLLSPQARLNAVEKVLHSACSSLEMSDRLFQFIELLKSTGHGRDSSENWESVTLRRAVGIVGLVIGSSHINSISVLNILLPILIAVLKRNAVIVVANDIPHLSIVQACNSNLPPGLVNFTLSKEKNTLGAFAHSGKISIICFLQSLDHDGVGGKGSDKIFEQDSLFLGMSRLPPFFSLMVVNGQTTLSRESLKTFSDYCETKQVLEL